MQELLDFAKDVAVNAGNLLLAGMKSARILSVEDFNEKGLITNADLLSNDYIMDRIASEYPTHTIISEELLQQNEDEYEWIVDPLDGTNNYVRNSPYYSVSICLRHKKQNQIGVVYAPALNEIYYAVKDKGAFLQNDNETCKISIPEKPNLNMFTFSFSPGIDFPQCKKYNKMISKLVYSDLYKHFRRRMLESTAYELCCVARGIFDAHLNLYSKIWDYAAGELILEEACGKITHFDTTNEYDNLFFASSPAVHAHISEIIKNGIKKLQEK